MGAFQPADEASLWKTGPVFSTGSKEAEHMVPEVQLNLRSTGDTMLEGHFGPDHRGTEEIDGPNLCTAFTERTRLVPPGGAAPTER
jgi:hypothetical protein